jgi:hypothetical protein
MTSSYRDIYKTFLNKIEESNEESDNQITHNEFVSRLPGYITEIEGAFDDVLSSAKRIKCSSVQSQRVKDMLMDDLKRLQRKVKTFISIASEEERSEEMEEYESEENSSDKEDDEDEEEVEEARKKRKDSDLNTACWPGYEAYGTKMKKGKEVPNCVPEQQVYDDPEELSEISSMAGGDVAGGGSFLKKKYGKKSVSRVRKESKRFIKDI